MHINNVLIIAVKLIYWV